MKKASTYKQMREQLDRVLSELETAEAGDIDKIIALHDKALVLIKALEDQLTKITKSVKHSKK